MERGWAFQRWSKEYAKNQKKKRSTGALPETSSPVSLIHEGSREVVSDQMVAPSQVKYPSVGISDPVTQAAGGVPTDTDVCALDLVPTEAGPPLPAVEVHVAEIVPSSSKVGNEVLKEKGSRETMKSIVISDPEKGLSRKRLRQEEEGCKETESVQPEGRPGRSPSLQELKDLQKSAEELKKFLSREERVYVEGQSSKAQVGSALRVLARVITIF